MSNLCVDHALVTSAIAGDQAAFGSLVLKYQGPLMRAVLGRVYNAEDAQDVVQETFINAYRAIGNFRGESQFYTWVYRIALNAANKYLSKRSRRVNCVQLTDFLESESHDENSVLDADTPESALISKQMMHAISEAMGNLSADHRTVFEMYEDGKSYEDISKVVGCPIGTVRSRISRAREKLVENLS